MKIEDVLVPVDFGAPSLHAIRFAAALMGGVGEIHLLHVIDTEFVDRAVRHGLGGKKNLARRMTEQAEGEMDQLVNNHGSDTLSVQPVIIEGKPFMEIVRLANELDFQMIVMGTHGRHLESIEQALFGSTSERVLRTTNLPVVCVPYSPQPEQSTAETGQKTPANPAATE